MKVHTLKDIALEAGVSAMTVSKVLNHKGGVSDATRQRVLEVAKQMNYSRNAVALSLREGETRTIGVVLSDSSEMVLSKVARGIQDAAALRGYSVIMANTGHFLEREKQAVQTLVEKRSDGLLLVAPLMHEAKEIEWLKEKQVPFVMLMRSTEDVSVDSVINDNYRGGYMSIEHLYRQGCRSFLLLPVTGSMSSQERVRGQRQALADLGIPESQYKIWEILQYPASGFHSIRAMISEIRSYDAVVCGCDAIAIGAMSALLDAGIRIPEEIRIIGYDGIDFCKYLAVPLTTVEQPLYEIGAAGVNVLLNRIKKPEGPPQNLVLNSNLVERRSTIAGSAPHAF